MNKNQPTARDVRPDGRTTMTQSPPYELLLAECRESHDVADKIASRYQRSTREARAERDALRAERDAMAEQIERVRALHRPTTVEATQGECAAEECAHGDACPTIPVGVCAECYRIGEDVYPWAYEGDGLQHVGHPCPTIIALDGDGGE